MKTHLIIYLHTTEISTSMVGLISLKSNLMLNWFSRFVACSATASLNVTSQVLLEHAAQAKFGLSRMLKQKAKAKLGKKQKQNLAG